MCFIYVICPSVFHKTIYTLYYANTCGPGSSVGIATDYGLDGLGIEKRIPVGARFFAHVQTGPGAHPPSCTMGTGSFPGIKRPGRGADHPPPSSVEVENEWSYTSKPPLGTSSPVIGWPLPQPYYPNTGVIFLVMNHESIRASLLHVTIFNLSRLQFLAKTLLYTIYNCKML
jgi:hypothetical protein